MKHLLLTILLGSSVAAHSQQPLPAPYMHYFYNSGWLVAAGKHFIVFDFIPHAASGVTMEDLKKRLRQIRDLGRKTLVMITHDHQDHFDPEIFKLSDEFPDIEYILGWNYQSTAKNVHIMKAGDSLVRDGYKVYTHASTDDGVGFLFINDHYSIYHAGDHALWAEQILQPFTDELKLIRSKTNQIDVAFVPAARGMFTKCAYDSVIEKGLMITLEILRPRAVALQHVGCKDKLSVYRTVYKNLSKKVGPQTWRSWIVPRRFNEDFMLPKAN